MALGPGGWLFEAGSCVAGAALVLWGWSRLRRAKADRPDQTWWQFLGADDLVALAVVAVLVAAFLALTREQRDAVVRSFLAFLDLIIMARGRL